MRRGQACLDFRETGEDREVLRRYVSLVAAAFLFFLLLPSQATAQADETRTPGLFVALSIGSGYIYYDGLPSGPIERESGVGGSPLRIGYRISPHLAVALQVHSWLRFGAETSYGGIQGILLVTPKPSRGLRLALGVGPESVHEDIRRGQDLRDRGLGVSLYAMYDW